jgi:hypothetical protein
MEDKVELFIDCVTELGKPHMTAPKKKISPKKKPESSIITLPKFWSNPKVMQKVLDWWQYRPMDYYGPKTLVDAMGRGSHNTMRGALRSNVDYQFESHPDARGVVKRVWIPGLIEPQFICIYHPDFEREESIPSPDFQRQQLFALDVIRYRGAISATMLKNTVKNHLFDVIKSMPVRRKCYYRDADGSWDTILKLGNEEKVEVDGKRVSAGLLLCIDRLEALAGLGEKTNPKGRRPPRVKTYLGRNSSDIVMYDLH